MWNTNATTAAINNLPAGIYSVDVSDHLGCTAAAAGIVVTNTAILSISDTISPQSCTTVPDGTVALVVTGGSPSYTYAWSIGGTGSSMSGLVEGVYQVTVTDSHGCNDIDTITVPLLPSMQVTALLADPICQPIDNGSILCQVNGGVAGYTYLWSNNSSLPYLSGLAPGQYTVTVSDSRGCMISDTFTLAYQLHLSVELDSTITINMGDYTLLTASPTPVGSDYSFLWSPTNQLSCSQCQSTEAFPFNTTQYMVTITDTNGCKANDSIRVIVNKIYDLYVPNAFTPNGDGRNDYFEIFGNKKAWKFVEITIFNRWGELLFQSNDLYFAWDGTFKGVLQPPGVYVYVLNVTFADGYSVDKQKGSITLIR
jgi:gliding motility-associated-like protein